MTNTGPESEALLCWETDGKDKMVHMFSCFIRVCSLGDVLNPALTFSNPTDFQCVNCAEPICVFHSFDHTHVARQSHTTMTVLQQRLCAFCNDVNLIIDDEWKMVQLIFVLNILILPIPCVCYYAMTCPDRVKKKVEESPEANMHSSSIPPAISKPRNPGS
ncbi:hypothetical protein QOT17_003431 [Balamuthia mandrillaris]